MLTDPQARVLLALREGTELLMHVRQTGRGPYYTLASRRLSVVMLKEMERRKFIERGRGTGQAKVAYVLTGLGEAALVSWEKTRSLSLP